MLSLVSTLISIQKHTRARVGLNRTWLTDLTEGLPQLVWAADSHGVKTFCSRKYLEYTGAETVSAMNSAWQSFIHPDDRIGAARRWFHSLATGEPYSAEYRLRRQDGTYRHFTAAALPIRNRSGRISSWLGISKDVHEDKLAEQHRHRLAGLSFVHRLAASIAHEINNPLEGLTNALYLARHSKGPDHRTREEYLQLAEQELERLSHVTSHSLRFHRQVGPPVVADVTTVMEAAVSTYNNRLQSAAITVDREYQNGARLRCFDQDMRQAFEHLIRNALDAMPAGGKLSLRIRNAKDWKGKSEEGVSVIVADTGTGIPAALREHLFEPFFSTKGEHKVGLGLWTTQQIVRDHNGSLTIRSRTGAVHHWTVFRVFLPSAGFERRIPRSD
jgi:PAS domain S-box-containing protein